MGRTTTVVAGAVIAGFAIASAGACGSGSGRDQNQGFGGAPDASATGGASASTGTGGTPGDGAPPDSTLFPDVDLPTDAQDDVTMILPDPETCQDAEAQESYVGCSFWPTVTPNPVWRIFDFTVVVANAGTQPADVTVTFQGADVAGATIPPNGLTPIYLPWVTDLKGPESDECGTSVAPTESRRADASAFHLTSTRPITVYQFNPLEYQGSGGPAGKDWSSCPGTLPCAATLGIPVGCFSFTNDASLLLPESAMTGNYRIPSMTGWTVENAGGTATVTATEDATRVLVQVSSTGSIVAGPGVTATSAGGILEIDLDEGDVVHLLSGPADDLSGSLVQADKPVQVLASMACVQLPFDVAACDHIEESVLPAESLGRRYFVARPTGPGAGPVGQIVRVYGNVDNTQLSYPSGTPQGAPAVIGAGQVVDMGVVDMDFEIIGDHEFSVSTFQLGGAAVDALALPGMRNGDPSQSQAVAVEQFRTKYVFIAPTDYAVSYVDVVQPLGALITLNGSQLPIAAVPIGMSNFGVARVPLDRSSGGVYVINGDEAFGVQVIGYGTNTSYQYPGGLSTRGIAPPPPPIR